MVETLWLNHFKLKSARADLFSSKLVKRRSEQLALNFNMTFKVGVATKSAVKCLVTTYPFIGYF